MPKVKPFSQKTNSKRLTRAFSKNQKFDLALRGRLRFKRRRLRLISRARLAAAKFIVAPFSRKKKKKK